MSRFSALLPLSCLPSTMFCSAAATPATPASSRRRRRVVALALEHESHHRVRSGHHLRLAQPAAVRPLGVPACRVRVTPPEHQSAPALLT